MDKVVEFMYVYDLNVFFFGYVIASNYRVYTAKDTMSVIWSIIS